MEELSVNELKEFINLNTTSGIRKIITKKIVRNLDITDNASVSITIHFEQCEFVGNVNLFNLRLVHYIFDSCLFIDQVYATDISENFTFEGKCDFEGDLSLNFKTEPENEFVFEEHKLNGNLLVSGVAGTFKVLGLDPEGIEGSISFYEFNCTNLICNELFISGIDSEYLIIKSNFLIANSTIDDIYCTKMNFPSSFSIANIKVKTLSFGDNIGQSRNLLIDSQSEIENFDIDLDEFERLTIRDTTFNNVIFQKFHRKRQSIIDRRCHCEVSPGISLSN